MLRNVHVIGTVLEAIQGQARRLQYTVKRCQNFQAQQFTLMLQKEVTRRETIGERARGEDAQRAEKIEQRINVDETYSKTFYPPHTTA